MITLNYPTDGIQNGAPDGFALVNASNQVVNEYRYDPWGEVESVSEGVQQPLRYMASKRGATSSSTGRNSSKSTACTRVSSV